MADLWSPSEVTAIEDVMTALDAKHTVVQAALKTKIDDDSANRSHPSFQAVLAADQTLVKAHMHFSRALITNDDEIV